MKALSAENTLDNYYILFKVTQPPIHYQFYCELRVLTRPTQKSLVTNNCHHDPVYAYSFMPHSNWVFVIAF